MSDKDPRDTMPVATDPSQYDQWTGPGRLVDGIGATGHIGGVLTYECLYCKDAGFVRANTLPDHKDFGKLFDCPRCQIAQRRRDAKAHGHA